MQKPEEILKDVFGYSEFRPFQKEIIEHALANQDGLAIMPTGGGKSICFQIPAILKPNITIVISPLISLMKDQVDALKANGVETAFYNSSVSESEKQHIYKKAVNNEIKLLYISPETLVAGIDWLSNISISMIAIDEAHCVSMWGHDFRPEYQQIGKLRSYFPNVPFMAFTATADKITRSDIIEKLDLKSPSTFISSFDRPNLSLAVRSQVPKKQKEKEVITFINQRTKESGIIYCLSRKETEAWSNKLNSAGINSRYYHAGLASADRDAIQEGFINDHYQVICATVAFGMGIDKSNVRWVIHNNLPKNIEGYYQEIGRAGRDGLASDTILYYNYRDVVLLNDFVQDSEFKEVYHEKINRILKYAEASSCRRKILLAYFGEHLTENCGNCDVCENPPEFIDGKIIAQKAISAALRSKEKLGINLMINVLRGAKTIEIFEKNLEKIKTYGVGSEYNFKQWQHFINHLINQGVFEIAYNENLHLKVTDLGHAIIEGKQSIQLTEFTEKSVSKAKGKRAAKPIDNDVVEKLKAWRKQIAAKNKVPAYVIFHDATLNELAENLPLNKNDLQDIQGFGKVKIDRFGDDVLNIIKNQSSKISTYDKTLLLHEQGLNLNQISTERNISEQTVVNHLIKLFEENKPVNLYRFINEFEVQKIKTVRKSLGNTYQLKPLFDALHGEIDYGKINMAIAILEKQKKQIN